MAPFCVTAKLTACTQFSKNKVEIFSSNTQRLCSVLFNPVHGTTTFVVLRLGEAELPQGFVTQNSWTSVGLGVQCSSAHVSFQLVQNDFTSLTAV